MKMQDCVALGKRKKKDLEWKILLDQKKAQGNMLIKKWSVPAFWLFQILYEPKKNYMPKNSKYSALDKIIFCRTQLLFPAGWY